LGFGGMPGADGPACRAPDSESARPEVRWECEGRAPHLLFSTRRQPGHTAKATAVRGRGGGREEEGRAGPGALLFGGITA
jgi:hypothetical protein